MDLIEQAIDNSIRSFLGEILEYQYRHSEDRLDGGFYRWARGGTRDLPILNEITATPKLVTILESALGGLGSPHPGYDVDGRRIDVAVVSSNRERVLPIEIKGYPTVQDSNRELGFRKDIQSLISASAGNPKKCYYIVMASFDNDDPATSRSRPMNWETEGFEDEIREIFATSRFSGSCSVYHLQMMLVSLNRRRVVRHGSIRHGEVHA